MIIALRTLGIVLLLEIKKKVWDYNTINKVEIYH
jgi:hypothetical protein